MWMLKIEILFNIRAKDSGIYPTHFQSDYKILDSYIKKQL